MRHVDSKVHNAKVCESIHPLPWCALGTLELSLYKLQCCFLTVYSLAVFPIKTCSCPLLQEYSTIQWNTTYELCIQYEADKWLESCYCFDFSGFSYSYIFLSSFPLQSLCLSVLSSLPSISHLMRHHPAAAPLLMNIVPHPVSQDHCNIPLSSDLQTPRPLWYIHKHKIALHLSITISLCGYKH